MHYQINAYTGNDVLIRELACKIATVLRDSIVRRGSASIVVSGGNTPKALFQELSQAQIDWQYVWVTLADERWVAKEHKDSNARMVEDNLLKNRAAAAHFVPLKTEHEMPCEAVSAVAKRLKQLAMPFDIVLLGMGDDGHTASLFPRVSSLPYALSPESGACCAEVVAPLVQHPRMTLTLPCLLDSKLLILYLMGVKKWQVLHQALNSKDVNEMPVIAMLRQHKVPVEIYYSPQ